MRLLFRLIALTAATTCISSGVMAQPQRAAWRESFRKSKPKLLGGGAVSKAWGNDEWVAKQVMRTGMWMKDVDPIKRKALADESAQVQEKLRNNKEFVTRFGDIIPETLTPRPGLLVQKRISGLKFTDLDTRTQMSALTHMEEILVTAEKIVPENKLDAFNGSNDNFRFDKSGKVTGWFDATHPEWIVNWKPGTPLGQGWSKRDRILDHAGNITRILTHSDIGHRVGEVFKLNDGFAQRYLDGHSDWGPRLLVSNPRSHQTYLVHYGFARAYEANSDPRSQGRPMFEKLGQPLEDEQAANGGTTQRFEHGQMSWNPQQGVKVVLDP